MSSAAPGWLQAAYCILIALFYGRADASPDFSESRAGRLLRSFLLANPVIVGIFILVIIIIGILTVIVIAVSPVLQYGIVAVLLVFAIMFAAVIYQRLTGPKR